ncbi:MAG: ferritin-like domain-containing protein [Bacillati bacterium ANGP1]|uniref:Ferritin-like domain-containing protein n=1 Tax=Candidatus Segetimicrobium genomatis TaxID=2569760 RepID=A0A537JUC3_9BACT|nr:MAG: ferritin-like domain-containing protein [Terrabacteria group bacterium ANGP1]
MSAPRTTPEEPEQRSRTPAGAPAGGTGSRQDGPPAADGPSAVPPAAATAPAGPPAHLEPGGALLLTGLRLAPVPDEASPQGIMFRGAPRAQPGPGMPYTLARRDLVWADNLNELIERAKRRQWNAATDIPWEAGRRVAPDLEEALADVLTWMLQQEYAAWYVPAKFVSRIHPAYTEVGLFLSTQVVDEARHVEACIKRLYLNGVGLREVSESTESSIKGLLMQDDFPRTSFLLHVLGEGTFTDLFHLMIDIAPDAATREMMVRSLEDEARHVAYGVGRLRTQLASQRDPDAVGQQFVEALESRLSFTYEVSGIPLPVQQALAVLAGGGRSPDAAARGKERVRAFVDELNRNRLQRLREAGFSEKVADHISQLHIRSAGGLM